MQHTSKVKDIQSFPLFLWHPESGSLMEITSFPPVNGLGSRGYCCQGGRDRQIRIEYTLSGGLPDGYIPALINHVRTFFGKEELIELVRHTLVIFRLADRSIDARHKRILVRPQRFFGGCHAIDG